MSDNLTASITLFFNTDDALKKLNEVQNRFGKTTNAIGSSFKKLSMVMGLFSGFSIKTIYDEVMKLGELKEKFNLKSIEELSQFSNALSLFGGNTDEFIQGVQGIQNAIKEFKTTGGGAFKEIANYIGLHPQKITGEFKNFADILDELHERFKYINEDVQLSVLEKLGLNSAGYIRMLRADTEEYKKMKEEALKMGVIQENQYKNVLRFHQSLQRIKQTFVNIGGSLLENITPFLDLLDKGIQSFNALDEGTKKLITGFMILTPLIKVITTLISPLTFAIGLLGLAWKSVWGDLSFNDFIENVKAGIEKIKPVLTFLKDFLVMIGQIAGNVFKSVYDIVNDIFEKILVIGKGISWLGEKIGMGTASIINFFKNDKENSEDTRLLQTTPYYNTSNSTVNNNQNMSRMTDSHNMTIINNYNNSFSNINGGMTPFKGLTYQNANGNA